MLSLINTKDLKNKEYDRDSYNINKAAQDIAISTKNSQQKK